MTSGRKFAKSIAERIKSLDKYEFEGKTIGEDIDLIEIALAVQKEAVHVSKNSELYSKAKDKFL